MNYILIESKYGSFGGWLIESAKYGLVIKVDLSYSKVIKSQYLMHKIVDNYIEFWLPL